MSPVLSSHRKVIHIILSQNTLCKRLFIHIRELLAPPNTICMCKRANFNMYRVVVSAYLYIFENSWPNRILYVCLYFRWRCTPGHSSIILLCACMQEREQTKKERERERKKKRRAREGEGDRPGQRENRRKEERHGMLHAGPAFVERSGPAMQAHRRKEQDPSRPQEKKGGRRRRKTREEEKGGTRKKRKPPPRHPRHAPKNPAAVSPR